MRIVWWMAMGLACGMLSYPLGCGGRVRTPDCGAQEAFCATSGICCPLGYQCGTGANGCPLGGCCRGPIRDAEPASSTSNDDPWDVEAPPVGQGGGSSGAPAPSPRAQ